MSSLTDVYRFREQVYPHVPVFPSTFLPHQDRTKPFLLAAIYLVTLPFASLDDYLSVQIAYDLPDGSKLWSLASNAVHRQSHKPDFSLLQTLILLLVSPSQQPLMPDYAGRWSLVGTIITTSQTLGLQYDPSQWNLPAAEIELRKRLSWTVKMIDVWHAAVLGRSCLIQEDQWLISAPIAEQLSHSDTEVAYQRHMVHLYELTLVLHKALKTLL